MQKRLPSTRWLSVESLESRALLTTIFVENGAENGDGSASLPFGSIQDAIDAAAALPGDDTIMIAQGVYEENLEIDEIDAVTLKGQGSVTIKHPELALFEDPEDVIDAKSDVTFQNLDIVGPNPGTDDGRGIDVRADSVTIRNVNISGVGDDALRIRDAAHVSITNGSFTSLFTDGIDIEDSGDVRLTNVEATSNGDEGLEVDDVDSIFVVGGDFSHNADEGLDIDNTDQIHLVNVTATDNGGNGMQIEAGGDDDGDLDVISNVSVTGSNFSNNGENGVQIIEGIFDDGNEIVDGLILELQLTGNHSNDNSQAIFSGKGFDIQVSGNVQAQGNKAAGNADNTLP